MRTTNMLKAAFKKLHESETRHVLIVALNESHAIELRDRFQGHFGGDLDFGAVIWQGKTAVFRTCHGFDFESMLAPYFKPDEVFVDHFTIEETFHRMIEHWRRYGLGTD